MYNKTAALRRCIISRPLVLSRHSVIKDNIRLTDITLLQSNLGPASLIDTFHRVISNHSPYYIELGKNTDETAHMKGGSFYQYVQKYLNEHDNPVYGVFVTQPKTAQTYPWVSYRTSLSSAYQQKMENMTLAETEEQFYLLKHVKSHKKLYISCISECPILGKIDINYVSRYIYYHHSEFSFDEFCLCDTCGNLQLNDFKYIVDYFHLIGIPSNKIGFQLSANKDTAAMIRYGIDKGIFRWDVVGDDFASLRGPITYKFFHTFLHPS
jgi:hypothetical protein